MNKLLVFLLIISISSCNKKEDKNQLTNNKSKDINFKSIKIHYKDNVNIDFVEVLINPDNKETRTFYFYEGNKLKRINDRCNDKLCGDQYLLDSVTGKITEFTNYIPKNRYVYENEKVIFNSDNDIIFEKSKFLSVKANHDTVSPGESITLRVKVLASCYPKIQDVVQKLVIGKFDNKFNLLNTKDVIIIPMTNGVGEYNFTLSETGLHEIKGFVAEKAYLSDSTDSTDLIYFTHSILVSSDTKLSPLDIYNHLLYDSLLGFERRKRIKGSR